MLSSIQSTTFATSHLCLFVTPRSDPAAVLVFPTASHHPVGESVWRVLEGFGGFGGFWRVLEGFGGFWRVLRVCLHWDCSHCSGTEAPWGGCWGECLEGFGGFWRVLEVLEGFGGFWRVLEGFEGLRAGTIESHCCGLGPGTIESHCCGLGPGVQDTCQGCSEVALALGCLFLTPHIFELKPPPFASVGMFPLLWH